MDQEQPAQPQVSEQPTTPSNPPVAQADLGGVMPQGDTNPVSRPSTVRRSFSTMLVWLVVLVLILVALAVGLYVYQGYMASSSVATAPVVDDTTPLLLPSSEPVVTDGSSVFAEPVSEGTSLADIEADLNATLFEFNENDFADLEASINSL